MVKSKLITLLKTFSKEEMKEFYKFISSPYFSRGRNLKPLYNVLKKYYPAFDSVNFTGEKVFKKLYPKKKFEGKNSLHVIRVQLSEILNLAYRFLQVENFNKNKGFSYASLLEELRYRNLNNQFDSLISNIYKELNDKIHDYSYFLHKYLIDNERELFWTDSRNKDIKKHFELQNDAENSLLLFFISQFMRYDQSWKFNWDNNAKRSDLSVQFNKFFNYEEFIKSLSNIKGLNSFQLMVLYYSSKLDNVDNDADSYFKLKDLFILKKDDMSFWQLYEIVTRLLNHCILRNKGDKKYFFKEYILWYKLLLNKINDKTDKSILNSVFSVRMISNIIKIYLEQGRISEMNNYVKKYEFYFPPENRVDIVNYISCKYNFYKCNFTDTLKFINVITLSQPIIVKELRIMKIKSLFELGYYEALFSEIDAYRHYLKSTSGIPENFILRDKNFLKILNGLTKCKINSDIKGIRLIKDEIAVASKESINMNWLKIKTDESISKIISQP